MKFNKLSTILIICFAVLGVLTMTSCSKAYKDKEVSNFDKSDWNDALDDYDSLVDDLIKLMNKANEGDESAYNKGMEVEKELTELASKLVNIPQGYYSERTRFEKMNEKMQNEVSKIMKQRR